MLIQSLYVFFFPGYLFLNLTHEEKNWVKISSTSGSIGPVRFGDIYPTISDKFIEKPRLVFDQRTNTIFNYDNTYSLTQNTE